MAKQGKQQTLFLICYAIANIGLNFVLWKALLYNGQNRTFQISLTLF